MNLSFAVPVTGKGFDEVASGAAFRGQRLAPVVSQFDIPRQHNFLRGGVERPDVPPLRLAATAAGMELPRAKTASAIGRSQTARLPSGVGAARAPLPMPAQSDSGTLSAREGSRTQRALEASAAARSAVRTSVPILIEDESHILRSDTGAAAGGSSLRPRTIPDLRAHPFDPSAAEIACEPVFAAEAPAGTAAGGRLSHLSSWPLAASFGSQALSALSSAERGTLGGVTLDPAHASGNMALARRLLSARGLDHRVRMPEELAAPADSGKGAGLSSRPLLQPPPLSTAQPQSAASAAAAGAGADSARSPGPRPVDDSATSLLVAFAQAGGGSLAAGGHASDRSLGFAGLGLPDGAAAAREAPPLWRTAQRIGFENGAAVAQDVSAPRGVPLSARTRDPLERLTFSQAPRGHPLALHVAHLRDHLASVGSAAAYATRPGTAAAAATAGAVGGRATTAALPWRGAETGEQGPGAARGPGGSSWSSVLAESARERAHAEALREVDAALPLSAAPELAPPPAGFHDNDYSFNRSGGAAVGAGAGAGVGAGAGAGHGLYPASVAAGLEPVSADLSSLRARLTMTSTSGAGSRALRTPSGLQRERDADQYLQHSLKVSKVAQAIASARAQTQVQLRAQARDQRLRRRRDHDSASAAAESGVVGEMRGRRTVPLLNVQTAVDAIGLPAAGGGGRPFSAQGHGHGGNSPQSGRATPAGGQAGGLRHSDSTGSLTPSGRITPRARSQSPGSYTPTGTSKRAASGSPAPGTASPASEAERERERVAREAAEAKQLAASMRTLTGVERHRLNMQQQVRAYKEAMGSRRAHIAEARAKELAALLLTRPKREDLVQRRILSEGDAFVAEALKKEARKENERSLSRLLSMRPELSSLIRRQVVREAPDALGVDPQHERQEKHQLLARLISRRPAMDVLQNKGIIVDEVKAAEERRKEEYARDKESRVSKLSVLLQRRPGVSVDATRSIVRAEGFVDEVDRAQLDNKRRREFERNKTALVFALAHRPTLQDLNLVAEALNAVEEQDESAFLSPRSGGRGPAAGTAGAGAAAAGGARTPGGPAGLPSPGKERLGLQISVNPWRDLTSDGTAAVSSLQSPQAAAAAAASGFTAGKDGSSAGASPANGSGMGIARQGSSSSSSGADGSSLGPSGEDGSHGRHRRDGSTMVNDGTDIVQGFAVDTLVRAHKRLIKGGLNMHVRNKSSLGSGSYSSLSAALGGMGLAVGGGAGAGKAEASSLSQSLAAADHRIAVSNAMSEIAAALPGIVLPSEPISRAFFWGTGASGELGMGDGHLDCPMPTPLRLRESVSAIVLGAAHTALLSHKGQVYTFGANAHGQLGLGDKQPRASPFLAHFGRSPLYKKKVTQLACGTRWTAFITDGDEVYMAGAAADGMLGADIYDRATKTEIDRARRAFREAERVAKGGARPVMALGEFLTRNMDAAADTVPGLPAIGGGAGAAGGATPGSGASSARKLKAFTFGARSPGPAPAADSPSSDESASPSPGSGLRSLTGSATPPPSAASWAAETPSRLDIGGSAGRQSQTPQHPSATGSAAKERRSRHHDIPEDADATLPVLVTELRGKRVVQVSIGADHAAALTQTGTMYCWGSTRVGQSGLPRDVPNEPLLPVLVRPKALAKPQWQDWWRQVACGHRFTVAVGKDANIYSWGLNDVGQLGQSARSNVDEPAVVMSLARVPVFKVAAGKDHAVALSEEGRLYSTFRHIRNPLDLAGGGGGGGGEAAGGTPSAGMGIVPGLALGSAGSHGSGRGPALSPGASAEAEDSVPALKSLTLATTASQLSAHASPLASGTPTHGGAAGHRRGQSTITIVQASSASSAGGDGAASQTGDDSVSTLAMHLAQMARLQQEATGTGDGRDAVRPPPLALRLPSLGPGATSASSSAAAAAAAGGSPFPSSRGFGGGPLLGTPAHVHARFVPLQPLVRLVDFAAGNGVTLGLSAKGEVYTWGCAPVFSGSTGGDSVSVALPLGHVVRSEDVMRNTPQTLHAGTSHFAALVTLTHPQEYLPQT